LEAFLDDLGRELNNARLYEFINEALPRYPVAPSLCRGLLSGATRHHTHRDAATRERLNDRGHAQGQYAQIEEGGHWLHVRDELRKFYNAALEELRRRELPLVSEAPEGAEAPTPAHAATPAAADPPAKKNRRRRRNVPRKPVPLTDKQLEAAQLVGEHKGNIAAAATAAGKTRQAMEKLYKKAMKKLGKKALPKPKTHAVPEDNRGQANIAAHEEEE
jgi:hypothetical protein